MRPLAMIPRRLTRLAMTRGANGLLRRRNAELRRCDWRVLNEGATTLATNR